MESEQSYLLIDKVNTIRIEFMIEKYYFPFGQELKKVEQEERSTKKAFVLGVYASAVHARWIDQNGKQKVTALAVASEPDIFWTGENAEKIISGINIKKLSNNPVSITKKDLKDIIAG